MVATAKNLLPGLAFVYALALASGWINRLISPLVNLEALTIGIILGMALGNLVRVPGALKPGITFSVETLLKLGIILLGLKLDFRSLAGLGPRALILVAVLVPSVLGLSWVLGRLVKADSRLASLIGVGSCICGASAVVAVTPVVRASKEDSVVAVSVVSFLGAVGVLVYTAVGLTCVLTDTQFGVWAGGTLQAVAHALAAAFSRGEVAGEIGTLVKMARVAMLVPVALVLGLAYGRGGGADGAGGTGRADGRTAARVAVKFPTYVLWFVLAGVLRSAGVVPPVILGYAVKVSATFILMAMIGMGLGVDFRGIRDRGLKALILGLVLFVVTSASVYVVVSRYM